jgi:hypothetical protein
MARLWKKKGIPHTGWNFLRTVEHDGVTEKCEMCDQPHIRYVDELSHENYDDILRVGQDCSEIMRLPGKSGFRWPMAEPKIIILENEKLECFFIVWNEKSIPGLTFNSLKDANAWVIKTLYSNGK